MRWRANSLIFGPKFLLLKCPMCRIPFFAILLVACGCGPDVKVTGFAQEENTQYSSSWRRQTQISLSDGAVPVADVEVYLAFDEEGSQPIPGTTCTTGPDGAYQVVLQSLPKEALANQKYYMIARKPSYHTFAVRFPTAGMGLKSTDVLVMARDDQ